MYNDVAEKHRAIEQIEESVAAVQGLFLDLALLTETQGGQIDHIEYQVKQAGDYIQHGNEELNESLEYGKKIRKRRRYAAGNSSYMMVLYVVWAFLLIWILNHMVTVWKHFLPLSRRILLLIGTVAIVIIVIVSL